MSQLDDTDLRILKALPTSGPSYKPVFEAFGRLRIDAAELGDRLELLAEKGLVRVERLGGSFAPGLTLPNGIHNVGLTTEGKQLVRRYQ
jgi:DNA-binding Lrp family transcriptional regulator